MRICFLTMIAQSTCRSIIQVLVVRMDIGVVTYEATTPQCGGSGSGPGCQSRYRSGDL